METDKSRKRWVLVTSLLCGIGGILYGYDIGVISGALTFIEQAIHLSTIQVGIIVGAVFFGGLLGTLIAGPLADRLGRRWAVICSCLLFIAGITFIILAHHFMMLWLARLLLGVAIGVVAVAVPLYVTELVPAADRGKYVALFQLNLTFGIVLAYAVDYLLTASGSWRLMFAVVFIPAIILLLAMLRLPESPRWLLAKGKSAQALSVLKKTCNHQEAAVQLQAIGDSLGDYVPGWREMFRQVRPSILFVTVAVAILNQGTGINVVLQYAPDMLKSAGISSHSLSMIGSMGIGLLQFIATLVAILLIDKLGRKPLLIFGTIGLVAVNVLLAVANVLPGLALYNATISLVGLLLFVLFYASGPGVVVWLVLSELFPSAIRSKGMAVCLFFNSLAGSLLTSFFPVFKQLAGMGGVYLLCAGFSCLYAVIAIFFLPEAKAQTLEQLQQNVVLR